MTFILGWVTLSGINNTQEHMQVHTQKVIDQRFDDIWGLMTEAHQAAKFHSAHVKDRILDRIEIEYPDPEAMAALELELKSPNSSNHITNIFVRAIADKWMYYDTNFNGMSISVNYDVGGDPTYPRGYLAATVNNNYTGDGYSGTMGLVNFTDILSNSYNQPLAETHHRHKVTGYLSPLIPFYQIQTTDDAAIVTEMTREALYQAYLIDGTAVFDGIVVTASSYIFDREDIFGVPDVSPTGTLLNNAKIIITQHFRVSDMLSRNHSVQIANYTQQLEMVKQDAFNAINYQQAVFIVLIIFWLVFVVVISVIQNNLAQRVEIDYLKAVARRGESKPTDSAGGVAKSEES
jgi:hypothetical protein